jgi:hypothetical protein
VTWSSTVYNLAYMLRLRLIAKDQGWHRRALPR